MKNKFLHFFSNYQWARRKLGGYWVYYFNDVVTSNIWLQVKDEFTRPPCCHGNAVVKTEDYR